MNIRADLHALRPHRPNLEETIKKVSFKNFTKPFSVKKSNPVMQASSSWKIVSDQLEDILGSEIHRQWFQPIRPLVISNNLLILQAPNRPSSLWINKHYQNLVDLLLSFQDKELNSFFVCPSDLTQEEQGYSFYENSKR